MKRKTEIIFEVEETIVLRQAAKISHAFCPQCEASVVMISPQMVADLSNLTEREIYRRVEIGALHFIETDGVLICLNSLINFKKTENPNDPLFSKLLRQ